MLEPVSVGLKFGFLAVLYLFLLWVARSAHARSAPRPRWRRAVRPGSARRTRPGCTSAADGLAAAEDGFEPRLLVEHAPGHESGTAYDVSGGATLGRGDVEIQLDDPFASSRHARITREGHVFVIEDLGSTNGTYLNDEPLGGPQPLHAGDRIRIGDSEFSYLQ